MEQFQSSGPAPASADPAAPAAGNGPFAGSPAGAPDADGSFGSGAAVGSTLVASAYRAGEGRYDEMVASGNVPRPHWSVLSGALAELGTQELLGRQQEAERLLHEDGAVYHAYGAAPGPWQPWKLDAVPTIIPSGEWQRIETAVGQRAELLSLVLADLYGPRDLLKRGLLPPSVVFQHAGFLQACQGIRLPTERQLFTYALDLGRDDDGTWTVLADRTQAPSGSGYALENRTVMSRVLPSLYRGANVHRLEPFFRALRTSLASVAPRGVEEPRIVVLTPGPLNETAFEHALLSSRLGYPLVEAADLVVREDGVKMRSPGKLEPVHVILRRVDGHYCDPLELRGDSQLGVPGLVEATRRGMVSVVNTLGSGALENPALMRFLPAIARELLGEDLALPCVPAWWCGEPTELSHTLEHLGSLVLRPISRSAGQSSIFGAQCSVEELDALRRRIQAHPERWVAQAPLALGDVPTLTPDGLEPRRSVLRTFAVATADGYTVMPGGLTRAAPSIEPGPVSNQAGAIAKDTWVIASEPQVASSLAVLGGPLADESGELAMLSAGAAENLWWLGRYAERAEASTRLLRTVHDRRNEFQGSSDAPGLAALDLLRTALTTVTDTKRTESDDPWSDFVGILVDDRRPGTLAHSVRSMLEAAHAVRDQLSSDVWLVVGQLDRKLTRLRGRTDLRSPELQGALQQVLQGLLGLSGLSQESMVRDLAWRFLDGGRRVERALQLLALLRSTVPASPSGVTGSLVLESVVTAAESIITYRRRSRLHWHLETVLQLLVLDEDNPRSVASQLAALTADLEAIPRVGTRLRTDQRLVLEATTTLRTCDPAGLVNAYGGAHPVALTNFLATIEGQLRDAAAAVERDQFLLRLPQQRLTDSWLG
ncbi:MAG: circularly permuted type 2 ATP-grasp protein [Solirubrobacteraceae bacterium]|nr:circularly permuted type 2 ATP-grasp protein [Solirubrobacteraceae bacterium]